MSRPCLPINVNFITLNITHVEFALSNVLYNTVQALLILLITTTNEIGMLH